MEETENTDNHREIKKKMKKKRKRTVITAEEMIILENSFKNQHRPDRFAKVKLAKQLGKSENFISIWFQNRRARDRKEKKLSVSGTPGGVCSGAGQSRGAGISADPLREVVDIKDLPLDLTKKPVQVQETPQEDTSVVRSPLFSRMIRMAAAAEGGILTTDCPYVGQAVADACRGILLNDGRLYYDPEFGFEIEQFQS